MGKEGSEDRIKETKLSKSQGGLAFPKLHTYHNPFIRRGLHHWCAAKEGTVVAKRGGKFTVGDVGGGSGSCRLPAGSGWDMKKSISKVICRSGSGEFGVSLPNGLAEYGYRSGRKVIYWPRWIRAGIFYVHQI